MSATIKDVARLAGCSIKSVSRVINDEPYVTPELRQRVQAAIDQLKYVPNISARRLVQKRSFVICILLHSGGYGHSELLRRFMETGYEYNYDILVQTYYPSSTRSKEKLDSLLREGRIDGLVTAPPCDMDDYISGLVWNSGVPLVRIDPFDRLVNLPYVAADNYQGAFDLTSYLVSLGHQRIAFFTGPHNHRASADRYRGYRTALEQAGLPLNPEMVLPSEFNFDGGYTAAHLALGLAEPPTALFAGSDEAALGSIYAMHEAGRRVPEDISIAGFDDLESSKQAWPGLTTVHTPYAEIVERAMKMLVGMLSGEETKENQVVMKVGVVKRGSTGKNA